MAVEEDAPAARMSIAEFQRLGRDAVPMAAWLDVQTEHLGYGSARLRLPFRSEALRPGGVISGPALMALADMTMYALVMGAVGPRQMAVTSDLAIRFLRKAPASAVVAEGRLLKLGRRLAVCEVLIYAEGGGDPVAQATGTYVLPE